MRTWAKFLAWAGVSLVGIGVIIFVLGPALFASVAYPLPKEYQETLAKEATANNISPNFLAGLIFVESRWDPNAHSYAGAVGLTQFIPSTARSVASRLGVEPFSVSDLKTNPLLSIKFGAYYISDGINRYGGDKRTALVAYNGGGAAVNAWRAGFPFRGTLAYAEKVLSVERMYDKIYGKWWDREQLPDLTAKSNNPIDLLTKVSITDFWKNLLSTNEPTITESNPAVEANTESPDVNTFWQNILGN